MLHTKAIRRVFFAKKKRVQKKKDAPEALDTKAIRRDFGAEFRFSTLKSLHRLLQLCGVFFPKKSRIRWQVSEASMRTHTVEP
jgi:hypothetical protein